MQYGVSTFVLKLTSNNIEYKSTNMRELKTGTTKMTDSTCALNKEINNNLIYFKINPDILSVFVKINFFTVWYSLPVFISIFNV